MSLWRWLLPDPAQLDAWTPQRAAQAEREMLTREGIVVAPHYLWSRPAQERERLAQIRRQNSWRKRTQAQVVTRERKRNVAEFKRQSER